MFKHILVPTDLTERSLRALEIAVKMALIEQSAITLLHVIETIEDTDGEDFRSFYRKLGKRAEKVMDRIVGEYEPRRVPISKEIIYGKRVKEIIGYASEKEIDLIILTSHRLDAENAIQGWGTISYKVGILSHCPVMLVK